MKVHASGSQWANLFEIARVSVYFILFNSFLACCVDLADIIQLNNLQVMVTPIVLLRDKASDASTGIIVF